MAVEFHVALGNYQAMEVELICHRPCRAFHSWSTSEYWSKVLNFCRFVTFCPTWILIIVKLLMVLMDIAAVW